jgi:hypothetical protein
MNLASCHNALFPTIHGNLQLPLGPLGPDGYHGYHGTPLLLLKDRKPVIGAPVEHPTSRLLVCPTPLLEEEPHLLLTTLPTQTLHLFFIHETSTSTALAANDHPMDSTEIDLSQIF